MFSGNVLMHSPCQPGEDKSGSVRNANNSYVVGPYTVFLGVHRIAKYFTCIRRKNFVNCPRHNFVRMLSEGVISPQEPMQFSQTK